MKNIEFVLHNFAFNAVTTNEWMMRASFQFIVCHSFRFVFVIITFLQNKVFFLLCTSIRVSHAFYILHLILILQAHVLINCTKQVCKAAREKKTSHFSCLDFFSIRFIGSWFEYFFLLLFHLYLCSFFSRSVPFCSILYISLSSIICARPMPNSLCIQYILSLVDWLYLRVSEYVYETHIFNLWLICCLFQHFCTYT